MAQAPAPPTLVDVDQLAEMFQIHPVTVRKRVAAREWPSTRIGRKLVFTQAQVEQIVRLCERPAVEAVRRPA
jgi:hypothetical protein